jgi:ubiquinone biosynthesis O-methyltransferase
LNQEIHFEKYERLGAYHWAQISSSLRRHNAFVTERYRTIIRAVQPLEGKRVLDLGCGDGVLSFLLHQEQASVVGIDIDPTGVDLAHMELSKRQTNVLLALSSGYKLPFSSEFFDCVVCSEVIEHVQQPAQLIQEIHRVLKQGGQVVVSTPNRLTEIPSDAMHVKEFFATELKNLIGSHFSQVKISFSHPVAINELYTYEFGWFKRPLFRYLFNLFSLLGNNPFRASSFRLYALLIGTGMKSASRIP